MSVDFTMKYLTVSKHGLHQYCVSGNADHSRCQVVRVKRSGNRIAGIHKGCPGKTYVYLQVGQNHSDSVCDHVVCFCTRFCFILGCVEYFR